MMSKCKKCNVLILDDTEKCPLCHHVLEQDGQKGENLYPDARVVGKKAQLLGNIILFVSIVAFCVCFSINWARNAETEDVSWWSLVVGLALIYVNVLTRLTILGRYDHRAKIIGSILIGMALLIEADFLTGNHGWGLNYAYPIAIILLNIGVLLLMLINRRSWQSYIIVQIGTLCLSVIGLLLMFLDIIYFPYLMSLATAISLFVFLGTMIIGDKRARTELKRRFHI